MRESLEREKVMDLHIWFHSTTDYGPLGKFLGIISWLYTYMPVLEPGDKMEDVKRASNNFIYNK